MMLIYYKLMTSSVVTTKTRALVGRKTQRPLSLPELIDHDISPNRANRAFNSVAEQADFVDSITICSVNFLLEL